MLRDTMMRPIIFSAALALTSLQAQAQPSAVAPVAPPTQATAPTPAPTSVAPSATPTRPSTGTGQRTSYRQTLQQRFEGANTTKDGHLTKDQAAAARWTYVSRNFDAMDKSHEGYVTVDDIRGYAAARRAARQSPTASKNG